MPRLATLLIAAVLALGFGGVQLAQSQTEPPPAGQPAPKAKKALTPEEKAERKAKRQAMTPEEKAKLKEERSAKKAKKAKRQECIAQGKQDNLKGPKLREFVKTCTG